MKRNKPGIKRRLLVCWWILTGRFSHFAIMAIDEENIKDLLKGNRFGIIMHYYRMHDYIFFTMVKGIAATKDDADMYLEKILFEAKAEEQSE